MIVAIDERINSRINSWCNFTHLSPEVFINQALEQSLDDWEDYIDAIRICADVDSGRMKVFSLNEVEKHLDELNAMES